MTVQPSAQSPLGRLHFDLTPDDQTLFLAEVDELLQRVEESLVDLERQPDDQGLLQEIFRAAHTIKGSSATIGHTRMAALTHAMETRLDEVRKGAAPVSPDLIEALLKSLDVLKVLRDEVETRIAAEVDVDAVAAAVERRGALRGGSARAPSRASKRATKAVASTAEPGTHRVTVALEAGPWSAVRALQALLALGELGRVISSDPPQAAIEAEDAQITGRLVVLVRTERDESALLAALNKVPELGAIAVEPITATTESCARADDQQAEALGRQEAAPAPRPAQAEAARVHSARPPAHSPTSKTIRIDVSRLDALLNLVGELVIDRTRLVQLGSSLTDLFGDHRMLSDLQQTALHIGRITDELQEQ
ncbi:MAG: Hpt domain-containing protein, partial [Chloroflexota bacterium]|nr:Hpt domain-containing protein [Chloroflexota bacterium]